MKIETVNKEAILRAFECLYNLGVNTVSINTVTDIINMFPVLMYDPEENKDGKL